MGNNIIFLIKPQSGMVEAFENAGYNCNCDDYHGMIKKKGFSYFEDHVLSISKDFSWAVIPIGRFPQGSISSHINFLKKLSNKVPTFHFMHDAILDGNFKRRKHFIEFAKICSVCSTPYICNIELYLKNGIKKINQIYQGFETGWYYPVDNLDRYDYDCIFVGSVKGYREKKKNILKKNGVNVSFLYGINERDVNSYYQKSKICINLLSGQYFSNRSMRVLGSGRLLMSDYNKDLTYTFRDSEDLVCWKNDKDMINKIKYYLENDAERERIALNGKNSVQGYTWDKQVEKMIRAMGDDIVIDGSAEKIL